MTRVRWASPALRDLTKIGEYIAQDNPRAAGEVVRAIWTRAEQLRDSPDIGRVGRVEGTRELVVSRYPFIVIYSRAAEESHILAVLHTSQQYPNR